MKTLRPTLRLCVGLPFLSVALAGAQPEQWLNYRVVPEGTGYRTLEAVTNVPPGVVLPSLGQRPYFARWDAPLAPGGGRWLCFDQSRKGGPYDRLYLDGNGNGRLDDETPIAASQVERYTTERSWTYFGPIRVTLDTPDGPVAYHLLFRTYIDRGRDLYVNCRAAGQYEGTVSFGGKKLRVRLVDENVNGTFNDTWLSPYGADEIEIEGQTPGTRAIGKYVEVEGELFELEVAPDGAFIKIGRAIDVKFGEVKVHDAVSELTFIGANGEFTRKPVKGVVSLPIGTYKPTGYTITRKDAKGATWRLQAYNFPDTVVVEVTPGESVTLPLGEPIRIELQPIELTNLVEFDLKFIGVVGEQVLPYRGNDRPRPPRLILAGHGGTYRATNTFEWG